MGDFQNRQSWCRYPDKPWNSDSLRNDRPLFHRIKLSQTHALPVVPVYIRILMTAICATTLANMNEIDFRFL